MLESADIGEIIIFSLMIIAAAFGAFVFLAFIYSMLFGGIHQSRMFKKLLAREQRVAEMVGGDNVHTLSRPITLEKISKSGLVMANITVGPSWWQLFVGGIKSVSYTHLTLPTICSV